MDREADRTASWCGLVRMKQAAAGAGGRERKIGLAFITTTVHDDYLMFIKLNYKMDVSPTNRDEVVKAELELRKRQEAAIELLRKIPGCEKLLLQEPVRRFVSAAAAYMRL